MKSMGPDPSTLPGKFEIFDDITAEFEPELDALHIEGDSETCLILFDTMGQENGVRVFREFVELANNLNIGLLIIRDRAGLGANAGFGATFGNTTQSAKRLSTFLRTKGYRKNVACGFSGSALSAIFFGSQTKAAGVILFGARTYLPAYQDVTLELNNNAVWNFNRRLENAPTDLLRDVRPIVRQAHEIRFQNHVGRGSSYDRLYSDVFETSAHADLISDDHDRHDAWNWLLDQGLLKKRVTRFVQRSVEAPPT